MRARLSQGRVPWTAWTLGCLSIAVSRGCIDALRPWRNPGLFSRGVPLGLVTSRSVVTTDASNRSRGAVCESMPVSGRLVYLGGPEGCVFSYPDRPSSWALSEICVRRHDVPIHGDAVRVSTGTTYFNEICGCGSFPSESELDMHIQLFGRMAGVGPFGRCAQQSQTRSITSLRELRSLCEQTKKRVMPHPVNHVSGGAVVLDLGESTCHVWRQRLHGGARNFF